MTPLRAALALLMASLAAGCAGPRTTERGITPWELDTLVDPVPGASASDYRVRERTLRLFGTQGDPPFATVADIETWETFNLHAGDTLGRGLRVASVREGSLTLADATGATLAIAPDADVPARTIVHRHDEAARYAGRGTWRLDRDAMKDLLAAHGAGATARPRADLFPVPAVELLTVDPDGVLAHLGLEPGCFLFELDGQPLSAAGLDAVAERAAGATPFTLAVYRPGAPALRSYRPE